MALSIKNVSKAFDSKKIFNSFSYEFSDHGIYAITGESGIGKTTLLRMISGLDTEFSGEIIGGGRKNVSVAFQEYRLFPELNVFDNVLLASFEKITDAAKLRVKEVLYELGFNDEDMKLFTAELSGGMKQRVSLARAFLREAPVLLLDEPTKELDSDNSGVILAFIKREAEKRLVIMVTHSLEDAKTVGATTIDLKPNA